MRLIANATILLIAVLLFSTIVAASPGKQDRFGCHKCLSECEKASLAKNEYHCHGTASFQSQSIQIAPRIYDNTTYRRVGRVIDGDTLTVYINGRQQPVRLLGIDAPEASPLDSAECYNKQATQKLNKLTANKFVLLQKDKLQKDDKDKYGRLLRYVRAIDTNISVGEELVKEGFAKAYPSITSTVEFYKKLENSAKEKKLGLWGECAKEKKVTPGEGERLFPLKGERYGSNNIN